jgi:uncharacterized protein DUF3443
MTSIDTRHRPRGKTVRKFVVLALIQLGFLAACGGGGGYGGGGGTPPPPPPTQTIATPGPPNVETMTVNSGPAGVNAVNTVYVSVKVCVPATTTCATIDHIEVDTGSTGLRILAGAPNGLVLPPEKDGSGNPMAECLQFADGTSWGSLAVADITLPGSGETASSVHVHIIGDPAYPTIPSACTGTPENTVAAFGANGILGVGPFAQDCGNACVAAVTPLPVYYSCPLPSTCAAANASLTLQVPNPVTLFATDNNGVIIELPAVGSAGSTTTSGSLVFGIGTRTNNGLGTATVLPEDVNTGFITGTYKGTAYTDGYLDSGSNGNFFTDTSLMACPAPNAGFYCPTSTMSETATLKGTSAATLTANFSVANADTLFSTAGYTAFSNLGGTNSDAMGFDLGLSFFYGHNVFTAIEGSVASGTMGPYFAY